MSRPRNPRLGAALALRTEGLTCAQIGARLRMTREAVAGMLWRHDHPGKVTEYDRRRSMKPGRRIADPYHPLVHYEPAKYPFAPDCSCPDFAWDDDHCAAVLSLGGYPTLQFRGAA